MEKDRNKCIGRNQEGLNYKAGTSKFYLPPIHGVNQESLNYNQETHNKYIIDLVWSLFVFDWRELSYINKHAKVAKKVQGHVVGEKLQEHIWCSTNIQKNFKRSRNLKQSIHMIKALLYFWIVHQRTFLGIPSKSHNGTH